MAGKKLQKSGHTSLYFPEFEPHGKLKGEHMAREAVVEQVDRLSMRLSEEVLFLTLQSKTTKVKLKIASHTGKLRITSKKKRKVKHTRL